MLAIELPMPEENLTVEAQAFVAKETGKCRVMVGRKVGGLELGKQVVISVAGASRVVAAAGTAARVEVVSAEEAAAAPVVPAEVTTAAAADLRAAVADATGEVTSGRSAPRRRATSSPNALGARVLATRRAHAHRMRRCWEWSCRCQKRISPLKPRCP